jgi:2-polyprenyl-3-methyl-5-hydroxy-6-metoxy-1,4-benzoquinol methylase
MLADTSQGMLDVLSAKIKDAGFDNLHPIRLDLTSQPALPTHFDVIYSLMVMHHIPEIAIVLRQFHALLNPDGYLCIADLEKEDGSFHGPEVRDVHPGFDRTELEAQVLEAGFRVVSFSKVYSIKKLVNGREKLFPIFLMVTKKNV